MNGQGIKPIEEEQRTIHKFQQAQDTLIVELHNIISNLEDRLQCISERTPEKTPPSAVEPSINTVMSKFKNCNSGLAVAHNRLNKILAELQV